MHCRFERRLSNPTATFPPAHRTPGPAPEEVRPERKQSSGKHDDIRFRQYINRLQKQSRPIICRSAGSGVSRPGARAPKHSHKNPGSPPAERGSQATVPFGKTCVHCAGGFLRDEGGIILQRMFPGETAPEGRRFRRGPSYSVRRRCPHFRRSVVSFPYSSERQSFGRDGFRSASAAPKNTTDEKRPAKIRRSV